MYALGDAVDVDNVYTQWVAQVRAQGGAATTFPGGSTYPAARYLASLAGLLGLGDPDATSRDGAYFYYAAPQAVNDFVAQNGVVLAAVAQSATAIEKGTIDLEPQWFKDLSGAAKAITVISVGAAVLYGLSFLPRPRGG